MSDHPWLRRYSLIKAPSVLSLLEKTNVHFQRLQTDIFVAFHFKAFWEIVFMQPRNASSEVNCSLKDCAAYIYTATEWIKHRYHRLEITRKIFMYNYWIVHDRTSSIYCRCDLWSISRSSLFSGCTSQILKRIWYAVLQYNSSIEVLKVLNGHWYHSKPGTNVTKIFG